MPIFLVIVAILLVLSFRISISEKEKQKAIQEYSDELNEVSNRAKSSQLFADLMQCIQKEICMRENGYARGLNQRYIHGDLSNWCKDMTKNIFQIREDGLYDCKRPQFSDDNATCRCKMKFADLGYSNLTVIQIEALTTVLGDNLQGYKPSYQTDYILFNRRVDRDRIAQFSQKVINDPAHYSEKMDSVNYRVEKRTLCNLCPTEEYLLSFTKRWC